MIHRPACRQCTTRGGTRRVAALAIQPAVQVVKQTLADESILVSESKRLRLVEQLEHDRRGEPIRE